MEASHVDLRVVTAQRAVQEPPEHAGLSCCTMHHCKLAAQGVTAVIAIGSMTTQDLVAWMPAACA